MSAQPGQLQLDALILLLKGAIISYNGGHLFVTGHCPFFLVPPLNVEQKLIPPQPIPTNSGPLKNILAPFMPFHHNIPAPF